MGRPYAENGRFYTRGRIIRPVFILQSHYIRLDELGQTIVVRLVMRLKYKDGHKTHYASGRTFPHVIRLNDALRKVDKCLDA